jgi:ribose 5-phosphate isomerase B
MAEQRPPTPDEVRAIVARVVDAHLGSAAGPASAPGGSPTPGLTPAPAAAGAPAPAGGRTRIAVGADHGGWELKNRISEVLAEAGFEIQDCGTNGPEAVDYPDIALAVACLVADGACRWGIVLDGAGIGSAMAANKVPGVRAANCHDLSSARNSREHNHANVLTLGARFLGEGLAIEIVRAWLGTDWAPGRHADRVAKITGIERRYAAAPEGARR